jgi:8-oxo-dGTP pyrophosphatase MutT (NUDIX family)
MTKLPAQQIPLKFRTGRKTDVRAQFAAFCWRIKDDRVQICLVTSRTRGRWILPKGWPMHNQTPAAAAATEAWEEAGLRGDALDLCLGIYSYIKPLGDMNAPIITMVYPVQVSEVALDWPEKHQRRRKWFTLKKAAKKITEPALQKIIATFDPAKLR